MTMDVLESSEEIMNCDSEKNTDTALKDIINCLTSNKDICFKNQQKWEPDLTTNEKFDIALEIFENNKLNFLIKFGKNLTYDQLDYFKKFTNDTEPDWEEMKVFLNELYKNCSDKTHSKIVKNRRFEALKQMVKEGTYFSEIEMMKRNPLLYEQLVGQYLTSEEIKERDKFEMNQDSSFVKFLMEGIERENAESYKKVQEEREDDQMMEEEEEEEDSSSEEEMATNAVPSTSRWGEFEADKIRISKKKPRVDRSITVQERQVLTEEFVSSMYQNFLGGKDEDFDYSTVDNDTSYDNMNEIDNDEEDKYFDSEEPDESINKNSVSSEDELDIYMNALTQHPSVNQLSKDLKKL